MNLNRTNNSKVLNFEKSKTNSNRTGADFTNISHRNSKLNPKSNSNQDSFLYINKID